MIFFFLIHGWNNLLWCYTLCFDGMLCSVKFLFRVIYFINFIYVLILLEKNVYRYWYWFRCSTGNSWSKEVLVLIKKILECDCCYINLTLLYQQLNRGIHRQYFGFYTSFFDQYHSIECFWVESCCKSAFSCIASQLWSIADLRVLF